MGLTAWRGPQLALLLDTITHRSPNHHRTVRVWYLHTISTGTGAVILHGALDARCIITRALCTRQFLRTCCALTPSSLQILITLTTALLPISGLSHTATPSA